ncbi:spermatogenesis-associated serine-rich protein 2-like, partial [Saccoglossus kowalevskii]|uniref:Spermatogenesis-associated serine-rich protein 2-like n=1 Tax=Saccoglossus kowalevskii TaxID=10224 RepID=A0ABM0GVB8_SACKO
MTAMAKKHGQKDSSEVYFDTTTKTVMAQTTLSQDKLKTKIAAVREVVSRSSNNDILLVLQYFDYDVDKTIQSFVEDGASEVLKEWNFTGKKSKNNKKNRKKGGGHNDSKPQNEKKAVEHSGEQGAVMKTSQVNNVDISTGPPSITNAISQPHTVRDGSHQDNSTKSEPYKDRVDAVSHKDRPTFLEFKKETATPLERHVNYSLSLSASGDTSAVLDDVSVISKTKRQRNSSECSNTSNSASTGGRNKHKKPMAVLERSVKDLQRTTVPLGRYKNLLNEEIDKSLKRMKKAFDGIRKAVDEREAEMIQQLKAVKLEGNELLEGRQNKAADLKSMTERGLVLKDSEIAELKAEIKHFVGERKVDEELGKTYRFKYEDETVIKSIREFGEIVPIKTRYTTRRQSVSSVTSSVVSHDDTTPLPTPTTPLPVSNDKDDAEDDTDEATAAELAELSARLQNSLKFQ